MQRNSKRTAKVNALIALLRTVDLRLDARKPLTDSQITEISNLRSRDEELALATAQAEAVRLARRITALDAELKDNHARSTELLEASPAAPLLEETGVGTMTAPRRLHGMPASGQGTFRGRVRRPRRFKSHPRLVREHGPAPA